MYRLECWVLPTPDTGVVLLDAEHRLRLAVQRLLLAQPQATFGTQR